MPNSKRKLDFLGDCNAHGVPLAEFQQQFCARCVQPECTRSQFGKTLFDQRVATWEERLFLNVPRLSPDDPRFKFLSGKNFQAVDVGPAPRVSLIGNSSAWNEAPLPEAPTPEPAEKMDTDPAPPPDEEAPDTDRTPPTHKDPSQPPPALAAARPAPKGVKPVLLNTPKSGGQMLQPPPSHQIAAARPPQDKWAPTDPNEEVLQPGARVKLGSV